MSDIIQILKNKGKLWKRFNCISLDIMQIDKENLYRTRPESDYKFAVDCLAKKSIDVFTKKYAKYINSIIRRKLRKNISDLDDIFQEIIIYLFYNGGLEKYKGLSKLSTWLFLVVSNRTVDFIRKKTRHQPISLTPEIQDNTKDEHDVLGGCIQNERSGLLKNALEKMRKKWDFEKTVMMERHYFEGLTYNQLSVLFAKRQTTVFNHINEAKKELKKYLIKLDID